MSRRRQAFVGTLVHCDDNEELVVMDRAGIIIEDGAIVDIIDHPRPNEITAEHTTNLRPGQILIPGFVDCHVHAVQLPNLGVGYDRTLLDWLEAYTFPLERKYADEEFAARVFDALVRRGLEVGTTTACYFGSLYAEASVILARKLAEFGQRAFVGKVNMNAERADNYFESTDESVESTRKFIDDVNEIGNPLVRPIVTPRFALSCDMELMRRLGDLAKEKGVRIQTHISENIDEIAAVRELFPQHASYSAVYEAAGLLTNKTILAHGVHLTDNELEILRRCGSAVIHCPSSNTCLRSGLCDVRRIKAKGVKIGLGTDVAGGQSLSVLDAMRSALQVSNHLAMLRPGCEPLHYKEAFYMATLGGAKSLSMEHLIGNFTVGKRFDALVVDTATSTSALDIFDTDFTAEEQLQRVIYSGDDRNVSEVYVDGKRVK